MTKNKQEPRQVSVVTARPNYAPDYAIGLAPGIVRLRDAPFYLGMNRNFFRDNVRKYLREIPIGDNGIGFHRLELDLYISYIKATIGISPKETPPWETEAEEIVVKKSQPFSIEKKPKAQDFDKVVRQVCTPSDAYKSPK